MLSIEEYIARRKKEDNLNEYDKSLRIENIQACVNYVFEYFNSYLDFSKLEEQTVLNNERLQKYRKQLNQYEPEIQDWMVSIYEEYDKQINRSIINVLKKDELFLLYNTDGEFRSSSYECYAQLVKHHPFLKDQTEMLFLFIKEYHRIVSQPTKESDSIFISEGINEWIENTWAKYKVNVLAFSKDWAYRFYDNEEMWPAKHRKKSRDNLRPYEYDFTQKNNLFNLNSLYNKMPKKPFLKGKKQEFEVLMMYFWLHELVGDDEGYWHEYLKMVIQ